MPTERFQIALGRNAKEAGSKLLSLMKTGRRRGITTKEIRQGGEPG